MKRFPRFYCASCEVHGSEPICWICEQEMVVKFAVIYSAHTNYDIPEVAYE